MILITGATGTNGRELVRQLSDAGLPVRAMVRNARDAGTLAGQKVDLVEGNFDKPETLDAALRGADKAFLLTPVAEKFVEWQRTFIEAARRAGVKHLVKFSGMGASATAPAELLRMHAQTDEVLGGSGIPFTILRPNSFHQNILASAGTIKAQGVFYLPLKHAAQSIVDIRDINAVAAKVLTTAGHEGKTYVITGPEALTFDQVAEKLSSVLGRRIQYVDVPPQAAADGMRKSGMPEWSVRVVVELLEYFASGAAATATDSVPKVLGKPGISFEQFARDFKPAFGG